MDERRSRTVPTWNDEKNLTDYWQVLTRRRWTIFSFFLICSTTVAIGTFLMTPLYRAETKIMIEGEQMNVRATDENSSVGTSYDIYENYLETQMALIKSDSVAGKVAAEFGLKDTDRYRKREGIDRIFQRYFTKDIYLERMPSTRMVVMAVEHPDPELATKLTNRLAQVYAKDNLTRRALTFIRNQRMASLNGEFLRLQAKLDSLSNQFGPQHPDMIALRQEIGAIGRRIEKERILAQAPPGSVPTPEIEDQVLLEDALLKIQESSVLASSKMNNIDVIDAAYVPRSIYKPKRVLNIALGIIAGLVGGVLLAFFVDYLDDTVKTEDEVRRRIGETLFLGSLLLERSTRGAANPRIAVDRLVHDRTESASAEAYRLIRTRVLWSVSKETEFKDLAIVSSIPGEGKSTVASNLAISLAQLNMKTLLVDTDMRQGRLHESFALSNERGIGHYLTEKMPLDRVAQKTDVPNLLLVASGKSPIDSSQLFSSPRMTDFIRESRERFDMVVYDTPPLTVIADTAIIISRLHGTVLTVRSGLAGSRILQKAMMILSESQANLIGVVFNASHSRDMSLYSQYYTSYQKVAKPR